MKLFTVKRAAVCATAALLGATAAGAAHAQSYGAEDTGFYLQGGYTYLDIKPDNANDSVDTHGITARAGYQFTPMFSVEADVTTGIEDGEFDYNVDEDEFDIDDNGDSDFLDQISGAGDVQLNYLVAAYARASIPVTNRLDVFARAGYAYIDLDATAFAPVTGTPINLGSGSEDGFTAGAGLSFDLTESWELRADYTYYGFDQADTNAGTVSVGYKF